MNEKGYECAHITTAPVYFIQNKQVRFQNAHPMVECYFKVVFYVQKGYPYDNIIDIDIFKLKQYPIAGTKVKTNLTLADLELIPNNCLEFLNMHLNERLQNNASLSKHRFPSGNLK